MLLLIPTALVAGGTAGYRLIEAETYTTFDALYMTVITLTTVGYGETHELSTAGRVFTIFLLLGGVFTIFFTAMEIIRTVISGEVQELLGRQRMESRLAEMKDHLIVCGYGRMGKFVCREFSKQGLPFVIVDCDEEHLRDFKMAHGIGLPGDATTDEVLKRAGVERARALVTVASSDADNLYITMTARLLNESLFIVARAETEPAEQKLTRAGANRVVSPYAIGGFRVAQAVLRPTVLDFIELATRKEHLDLQIEETVINKESRLCGVTLQNSQLRQTLGVIVVAIKKLDGGMVYNPPGYAVLDAGDTVIALGHRQQLDQLEAQAGSSGVRQAAP